MSILKSWWGYNLYIPQNIFFFSEKQQSIVEKDLGPAGTQWGLPQPSDMHLTSIVHIFELVYWKVKSPPRCLLSPTMPTLGPCSQRLIAKGLRVTIFLSAVPIPSNVSQGIQWNISVLYLALHGSESFVFDGAGWVRCLHSV